MPQLDVIIPAAGCGQRIGVKGSKGLISLGEETVIQRQVRQLRTVYGDGVRIIVVGGHKHDKLYQSLPEDVSFVVNVDYATTNVARSISVGLQYTQPENPALIVYGDLVFDMRAISHLPPTHSAVLLDEAFNSQRTDEVGVLIMGDIVLRFSFGVNPKWAHIAMLMPAEKAMFQKACIKTSKHRYFGYEILNDVLEAGGHFGVVSHKMHLVEIDTAKDILKARGLARENPV